MAPDKLEVKTSVRRVITGNQGAKLPLPATCETALSLKLRFNFVLNWD
jgi:hypothetical protein